MAKFFYFPFAKNGNTSTTPDIAQINGSVSYEQGYPIDYQLPLASNPAAQPINRAQYNGVLNDITGAILQLQSQGVANWIGAIADPPLNGANFPYPINAMVYYSGRVYQSAVAANVSTPGIDASWVLLLATPAGSYLETASTVVPAGYLACDGTSYAVATYPALFAAIGYVYGGSGANFNVPTSARRSTMGSGGSATAEIGNVVGDTGGAEAVTLAQNQLPATMTMDVGTTHFAISTTPTGLASVGGVSPVTITLTNTGGGQATNIIQPSMVVLRCIKY